jgi:DNA-binding NarL/FixJ family response regulator
VFSRNDASASAKSPGEHGRILIVEDDYLISAAMEGALTEAGFEIAGVASSAQEALELAASHEPELVVMDVRITGHRDGVDTALELFARHGIRSIFATAHHSPGTVARAQRASPLAWVPKPYTMASLVEAVRQAFRDLRSGTN